MTRAWALFLSMGMFGCSDGGAVPDAGEGGATADAGPDVFVTAQHAAAPSVEKQSGPVLATPKVVIVTFNGDPLASQLEAFAQAVGATTYWKAVTGEYGVGALQYAGAVHTTAPSTTSISTTDLETWLASQLDGTHSDWPVPDGNTIYSIVMPKGAGIQIDGAPLCKGSPAYHYELTVGAAQVPYAAVNRCDPEFGLSGIDYVTAGLSHEWAEAVTDPFYLTKPAYIAPPPKYTDWYVVTGGELADMCTTTSSVYYKPSDLPFTVQRSWSNAVASQGHDPCVPSTGVYFNAAPVMPDTVKGKYYGQTITSEGVHVALGASVTIEVDLFADGDTQGPWQVKASASQGTQLAFSWDTDTGQNGDKLNLTITRIADPPGMTGIGFFTLISTLGDRQTAWVGAVGD